MDSAIKPLVKRQLLFLGASFGAGLLFTYLFGFIVGLVLNIALLVGMIFYIRWRQLKALRSLGFSNEAVGGRYATNAGGSIRLKYVCLACGSEVKGTRCTKCGSRMKKPLF